MVELIGEMNRLRDEVLGLLAGKEVESLMRGVSDIHDVVCDAMDVVKASLYPVKLATDIINDGKDEEFIKSDDYAFPNMHKYSKSVCVSTNNNGYHIGYRFPNTPRSIKDLKGSRKRDEACLTASDASLIFPAIMFTFSGDAEVKTQLEENMTKGVVYTSPQQYIIRNTREEKYIRNRDGSIEDIGERLDRVKVGIISLYEKVPAKKRTQDSRNKRKLVLDTINKMKERVTGKGNGYERLMSVSDVQFPWRQVPKSELFQNFELRNTPQAKYNKSGGRGDLLENNGYFAFAYSARDHEGEGKLPSKYTLGKGGHHYGRSVKKNIELERRQHLLNALLFGFHYHDEFEKHGVEFNTDKNYTHDEKIGLAKLVLAKIGVADWALNELALLQTEATLSNEASNLSKDRARALIDEEKNKSSERYTKDLEHVEHLLDGGIDKVCDDYYNIITFWALCDLGMSKTEPINPKTSKPMTFEEFKSELEKSSGYKFYHVCDIDEDTWYNRPDVRSRKMRTTRNVVSTRKGGSCPWNSDEVNFEDTNLTLAHTGAIDKDHNGEKEYEPSEITNNTTFKKEVKNGKLVPVAPGAHDRGTNRKYELGPERRVCTLNYPVGREVRSPDEVMKDPLYIVLWFDLECRNAFSCSQELPFKFETWDVLLCGIFADEMEELYTKAGIYSRDLVRYPDEWWDDNKGRSIYWKGTNVDVNRDTLTKSMTHSVFEYMTGCCAAMKCPQGDFHNVSAVGRYKIECDHNPAEHKNENITELVTSAGPHLRVLQELYAYCTLVCRYCHKCKTYFADEKVEKTHMTEPMKKWDEEKMYECPDWYYNGIESE